MADAPPQPVDQERYEEIVQRLAKVVERLESGGLSLEESIAAFEEGIKLARAGARKLEEAERKVEVLLEGDRTAPFTEQKQIGTVQRAFEKKMPGRKKIIIVDDDRETREMLKMALELEGYEVAQAANGLRLISTLHVDRPDLILLDVMMSWIDGFELCRAVKKNDEFRDIPVIFISAKKTAQDIRTGLAAGAADYFSKPIDMERLLAKIASLIGPPVPPPPSAAGSSESRR